MSRKNGGGIVALLLQMRWSFTDCTHNKHLVADVLGRSEVDKAGPVYLICLEDHTQEQVFDVGKILVTAARVKEVWLVEIVMT